MSTIAATPGRVVTWPSASSPALAVDDDVRPVHLPPLREPRRAGVLAHALAVGGHAVGIVLRRQADVQRRVRALGEAAAARREQRRGAGQVDRQVLAGGAEAHRTSSSTPSTGARWAYSKWAVPSATSVSRRTQPERPRGVRSHR